MAGLLVAGGPCGTTLSYATRFIGIYCFVRGLTSFLQLIQLAFAPSGFSVEPALLLFSSEIYLAVAAMGATIGCQGMLGVVLGKHDAVHRLFVYMVINLVAYVATSTGESIAICGGSANSLFTREAKDHGVDNVDEYVHSPMGPCRRVAVIDAVGFVFWAYATLIVYSTAKHLLLGGPAAIGAETYISGSMFEDSLVGPGERAGSVGDPVIHAPHPGAGTTAQAQQQPGYQPFRGSPHRLE